MVHFGKKKKIIFAVAALLIIILCLTLLLSKTLFEIGNNLGLKILPPKDCTDSDNGTNIFQFGICTDSRRQSFSDSCVTTGLHENPALKEWKCENNSCVFEIAPCPKGTICLDGECVHNH